MKSVYLDNNATTAMLPEVWEAMAPYAQAIAGNPGSSHWAGRRARKAMEDARQLVAHCLDAHADEVVFTSGATESNNIALQGLFSSGFHHVVSSPVEHPSVSMVLQELCRHGCVTEYASCSEEGIIGEAGPQLRPGKSLLVCMLVNNETGSVTAGGSGTGSPLAEAAKTAGVPWHCDATQAAGRIPVSFRRLGATTLAASAHKFHGPRGVGLLLVDRKTSLHPLFQGGNQERKIRPGTEPVALIAGLAKALEIACNEMDQRLAHVQSLRSLFLQTLRDKGIGFSVNGTDQPSPVIPHTLNLSFPGIKGSTLQMNLDLAGIACSTGAACASGSMLPSPILKAMNLPADRVESAIRISLCHLLEEADIRDAAETLATIVKRLTGSR